MTKFICETKNLSKKYKDFYALKNVNLTIPKGEIYGLVGENGAGKTTLIRLLTGLNFKSEGEIILFGHNDNLQYERSEIGCTIEMPALYKDMTASQNLEVQRIQRGIPNKSCIADTLELIGFAMVFSITHRCVNFTKEGFCSRSRYLLRKSPQVICPVTI